MATEMASSKLSPLLIFATSAKPIGSTPIKNRQVPMPHPIQLQLQDYTK